MPKPTLRRQIRERLRTILPEERARRSEALCAAIVASPEWARARTVGLFAPLPSEPDLDCLWPHRGERQFFYPRVEGERLAFYPVPALEALEAGSRRLREPRGGGVPVAPGGFDLLLVPGVAFTREGFRMGRGGGFYDRFLAEPELQNAIFGVCFREQIVADLPLEWHDRPVSGLFEG